MVSMCVWMTIKLHYTHLHQGVLTEQWAGESWRCSQKSRVCHFLYGLTNGKDQSSIHERNNDVGIKFIWRRRSVETEVLVRYVLVTGHQTWWTACLNESCEKESCAGMEPTAATARLLPSYMGVCLNQCAICNPNQADIIKHTPEHYKTHFRIYHLHFMTCKPEHEMVLTSFLFCNSKTDTPVASFIKHYWS